MMYLSIVLFFHGDWESSTWNDSLYLIEIYHQHSPKSNVTTCKYDVSF